MEGKAARIDYSSHFLLLKYLQDLIVYKNISGTSIVVLYLLIFLRSYKNL